MEAPNVDANDPSLELRRNELGLRYLYKLKSNPSYIHTLNTLDDSEDQKYEESERSVNPWESNLEISNRDTWKSKSR